jgi:flagellar basal-body rod modification protein FlgD
MAAMAGILNHQMTAGQALTAKAANPMAAATAGTDPTSGTSSTDSAGGDSATISANDFLTLLVTEMQNQDPTAQTDPNEYINQLVQVNSLEQLIDINQNLTTAIGGSGSTSSGSTSSTSTSVTGASPAAVTAAGTSAMAHKAGALAATHPTTAGPAAPGSAASTKPGSSTVAAISQFAQSVNAKRAPGNLSVPAAKPASHSVGHALDGHSPVAGMPGK